MQDVKRLDDATVRELAVKAGVCPRSIKKVAMGEPVRGMAGHRARAVLAQAGIIKLKDDGGAP